MAKLRNRRKDRSSSNLLQFDSGHSIIDITDLGGPALTLTLQFEDGEKDYPSSKLTEKHVHLAVRFVALLRNAKSELSPRTLETLYNSSKPFFSFLNTLSENSLYLHNIDTPLLRHFLSYLKGIYPDAKPGSLRQFYKPVRWLCLSAARAFPDEVSEDVRYDKLPRRPFPQEARVATPAQPYSLSEKKSILRALSKEYRDTTDEISAYALSIRVALLIVRTGFNVSSVLSLSRKCLVKHPIDPSKEILIGQKSRAKRYVKHSSEDGHEREPTSTPVGKHAAQLVREIARTNQQLADSAPTPLSGLLAIYVTSDGETRQLSNAALNNQLNSITRKHGLQAPDGKPLTIRGTRLRATFGRDIYRLTGDILTTARLLNHKSSIDLAANTYIATTEEDHRNFSFLGQSIEEWARARPTNFSAPAAPPLTALESGENNTSIARCSDPVGGKHAPRDGSACTKILQCFKCPQMVVFKDDLHRLLSFYYALINEKYRVPIATWNRQYAWIIQLIDKAILPEFEAAEVEDARQTAQSDPHPIWAIPGLLSAEDSV